MGGKTSDDRERSSVSRMIKLDSGRTIRLHSLNQELTYAALLEGIPRNENNDRMIEVTRREAAAKCGHEVIVIDPVRRPGPNARNPSAEEAWGPTEYLPQVTCVATFESSPVRNAREDCSLLVIVWFQETFAMPIDPGVLNQIRKIDWEKAAFNFTH